MAARTSLSRMPLQLHTYTEGAAPEPVADFVAGSAPHAKRSHVHSQGADRRRTLLHARRRSYAAAMTDVAFDVLSTLDDLKSAGFSEPQARALTHGLQSVASVRQGDLATKADIADLRREMQALESRLLKSLNDQQRWNIGFTGLMLTVLFAAIKLL
jgi:hypothetical protein